ncbi:ABC transporter permease [Microbacterium karelineae]|uniref:ABC transporter permease n=1 Tax=Microbacterium karelineae TaxID=2654283 RepID=UPI0012EA1DF3|nr:ABC transporter permease [Microbacterium karelineae]
MLRLILTRIGLIVPQLLILSVVVFLMTYLVPGSVGASILGVTATPEGIAQIESQLGLDRPMLVRLGEWYAGVLVGDFGTSYVSARPVTELFAERLPATFSLLGGGILIALMLGIAVGVIGGTKAGSVRDRLSTAFSSLSMSVPEFWIGIVLLLVFSVQMGIFPVVSYVPIDQDPIGWLRGLILPAVSLGIVGAALIARQTRTAMAETMSARYVDTLLAAGVSRGRVIRRYALKNALVSTLSAAGIAVSIMVGASFAIEKVFAYPGIGSLMLRSVTGKDFAVVQGGVLLIALIVIIVNLVLDVSYGIINPKVRAQ